MLCVCSLHGRTQRQKARRAGWARDGYWIPWCTHSPSIPRSQRKRGLAWACRGYISHWAQDFIVWFVLFPWTICHIFTFLLEGWYWHKIITTLCQNVSMPHRHISTWGCLMGPHYDFCIQSFPISSVCRMWDLLKIGQTQKSWSRWQPLLMTLSWVTPSGQSRIAFDGLWKQLLPVKIFFTRNKYKCCG